MADRRIRKTRIEDYLSGIESLCENSADRVATTGSLARLLEISNGTASSMLKRLADDGLVIHSQYAGASLTEKGRLQARRVLRRRRLIELFLSKTFGLAWENVTDEAWRLEPVVSNELIRLIDRLLDHPVSDPHGDPIPFEDGTLPASSLVPLTACGDGESVVLSRFTNQSEDVLRFLRDFKLEVGLGVQVQGNSEAGGVVTILTPEGTKALGYGVSSQILVRRM